MAGVLVGTAYAYLAVISVLLAVIDIRTHRLPNRIVLPAYPAIIVLLSAACVAGMPWASLGRAMIGMLALAGFYAIFRLADPRAVGGGDVKLAGVLGLFLGWVGWGALVIGAAAAFVLGGVWASALMLRRRVGAHTALAFGPWMLAGAWLGIVSDLLLFDG